jgi:hypothetical protein
MNFEKKLIIWQYQNKRVSKLDNDLDINLMADLRSGKNILIVQYTIISKYSALGVDQPCHGESKIARTYAVTLKMV